MAARLVKSPRHRGSSWLPGLAVARSYERAWLRDDLLAGAVVTALLIPAGMGYAEAAGLPAVSGLYATIVPLLAYALFGPSRILVLGPDSALVPVIAAAIAPGALGDPDRALALAGLLAILAGAFLVLGGLAKLGLVMDLLSKPIRVGYLNGIALTVLVSQLPKLFGFSVDAEGLVDTTRAFVEGVVDGDTDGRALALGAGCLATIFVLRRVAPRVPAILVAVVGATIATTVLGWSDEIPVVGRLAQELPTPALGGLTWDDVVSLVPAAAGVAVIAFADTGVLSRVFAARHGQRVDASQEMAAVGLANVACGCLGGFPVSGSASRTPTAEQAGARTQLTGVVGAALIVVLILVAPGLTENLPSAALAAVVIAASATLFDLDSLWRLARMSRTELALSLAAFFGVALVGVLRGIALAIALSIVAFISRAWRPYATELVRVDQRKGYHDIARHPEGRRIPGLVIARFDAPLFFANGGYFDDFVRNLVDRAPQPVRWVIVAAEPITGIDTTAIDGLTELHDNLHARGVHLAFAEMKGPVKDRLARFGLSERFGPDRFYPTIGTAVDAYLAHTGTPWIDWEQRDGAGG